MLIIKYLIFTSPCRWCTHVDDHADGGESSSQILWVRRPHCHGDDPRIETAIEGSYQVNTCRRKRWRGSSWTQITAVLLHCMINGKIRKMAVYTDERWVYLFVHLGDKAAPHCLLCWGLLSPLWWLWFFLLACEAEHKWLCTLPPPRAKTKEVRLNVQQTKWITISAMAPFPV